MSENNQLVVIEKEKRLREEQAAKERAEAEAKAKREAEEAKAFRRILVSDGFERLIKMVLDATPNEVLGDELTSMVKEALK